MIVIAKWAGLFTNASPYVIPPGAAVTQVNLQALVPGQVTVRPGLVAMSFATHAAGTQPIVEMINYPATGVVYQNAAGHIYVGLGAQ